MDLNNSISLSSRSLISTLDLITSQFINQLSLILTIVGLLGFIGNAFTFLQPALRWNTFCIYTLCGSLVDILNLFINLLPNYTNKTNGNLAVGISESILCKLKLFILTFLPKLSTTLMILSLIDRYACSSALTSPIRHLRQLKVVPWLIGVTAIITIVISSYALILYDIVPGVGCSSTSPLLNSILYVVIEAILLPMVMIVFILLTYQNIRQSRRRVVAMTIVRQGHPRTQFIGMIFVQIFASSFFVLQWMSMYAYYSIARSNDRTAEEWAVVYFVLSLTNNLYYVNSVKSFYLSTLTSRLFRQTFKSALLKLFTRNLGTGNLPQRTG